MKRYRMSLKHWRTQQTKSFEENLPLYLNVFQEILETLKFLGEARILHHIHDNLKIQHNNLMTFMSFTYSTHPPFL
jgi:hypothetical protein